MPKFNDLTNEEREKMAEETRVSHGISRHLQGDLLVNRKVIKGKVAEKKHDMADKMKKVSGLKDSKGYQVYKNLHDKPKAIHGLKDSQGNQIYSK